MTRAMDQGDTLGPEPDLYQELALDYPVSQVRIGETLVVDMVVVTADLPVDTTKEVW